MILSWFCTININIYNWIIITIAIPIQSIFDWIFINEASYGAVIVTITKIDQTAFVAGPPRARTTLLTLLARLEEKGCVTREKQGRGYLYTAALTRAAYLPAESCSLWGRLFGGSPRNFVAALAETDTLTDADIDELAEYLEELKKERK